jgi:hypothetical protein
LTSGNGIENSFGTTPDNLSSKYPLRDMFFKSYSFEEHQIIITTTLMPSNK